MDRFLIQVTEKFGYPDITNNQRYRNNAWKKDPKDKNHGEVKPGDELLVYCTGNVPKYGKSLAFSVGVRNVSPDKITFDLDEPHWFPSPLGLNAIRSLVAENKLKDAFLSCGTPSFNIAKLEPLAAQQVLELVKAESHVEQDDGTGPTGSPADRLVESNVEQWLVDHWNQVNFGAPLQLYEENGETVGQQYDTGSVGIIDLLCEDTSTGALVVMELKRGQQSDAVVGQLARHMGWVKEHLANGRDVEGVVLTPEYAERLRYAIKAIPGSRLLRYETRFEIFPQNS